MGKLTDEQLRDSFDRSMGKFYEQGVAILEEAGLLQDFEAWQAKYGLSQRLPQTKATTEPHKNATPPQKELL